VLPIIRHHHERLDGTGYPDNLRGEEIPITARVLQMVDVFDALSMSRPYKPALAVAEVMEIMESEVRRGWWDPAVFAEFKTMVAEGETN
jgi:putative two-component system response regulator